MQGGYVALGKKEKILIEIKLIWKGVADQIRSLSNDINKLRRIKRTGYKAKLVAILFTNPIRKKVETYDDHINKIREKCKKDVLFLHN